MGVGGEIEEGDFGVLLAEVIEGPGGGEEDDGLEPGVFGDAAAGGEFEGVELGGGHAVADPFEHFPRGGLEAGGGAVFGLEAILDDLELQGADGGEEGDALPGVAEVEDLDDAFLEQLVHAFAELLEFAGVGIVEVGEALGGETGDLVEDDGGILGEGVADAEAGVAHEADDVAGVGFVDGFAFLAEEFVGAGEADFLAGLGVGDDHVALEFTGADADEGDAIAVPGVHVGLDLEDEAGEEGVLREDEAGTGAMSGGRGGALEEGIEEELDAEVIHGAAEEDGGEMAGEDFGLRVFLAGDFEHFEFLDDAVVIGFVEFFADERVGEIGDGDRGAIGAGGGALEEMDSLGLAIEDAAEAGAGAEGPIDREGADAEDAFELIDQGEGIARGAVDLVHEGEDGDAAAAADLEEFAGLGLDAFAGVDDHDHGIDGGEDAIGVLGEILVAGGIEEIDAVAGVIELEDRRADGDAAFAFEFHPIGGGGALVLAGLDGAGELEGAAVEEELLGERGLAGVGMGDDGEGAAPGDFSLHCALNGGRVASGKRGRGARVGEEVRVVAGWRRGILLGRF